LSEKDQEPGREDAPEQPDEAAAEQRAEPSGQRVTIVGWRNWGDHPVFVIFTVVAAVTGLILAFLALDDNDSHAGVSDPCVDVIGRWDWLTTGGIVTVAEGGRLTFHPNDLTPVPMYTGNWQCAAASGEIAMSWSTNLSDRLTLSEDGSRLSGTNDQTGDVISATRAR
jgi:hypothetical protein